MKLRTFLFAVAVTFTAAGATAQTYYETGWKLLLKNDRAAAREKFTAAVNSASDKADAFLSLALIDWIDGNNKNGFANFKKFYEASSEPYAAMYAVSTLPIIGKYGNYQEAEKVAFYEQILNDSKLNGTLRATICATLAEHYRFIKNDKKANEYISKLGVIDKWQVLGSFDNVSGSGFVKDWGAVEKTQKSDVFKNKANADMYWYEPAAGRFDRWIDFSLYFTLNSTVNYAQTFVTSPVQQEVYLRAGTSGSLKVWLNDELVAEVQDERNCDLDLYASRVTLRQGANRILVQIGQSDIDRSNFMLRFTDENANPITGLAQSAEYLQYEKIQTNKTCELLPFYPEEELQKQMDKMPDNPLYRLLLAQTYLRNDKAFEATSLLKSLEEKYPGSTIISNSLLDAYMRSKNNTDHTREIENIKKNDPESYPALQILYSEALEQERYDEALEIIDKIIKVYGESAFTEMAQISLASYQRRTEDMYRLCADFYKRHPENWTYARYNYQITKNTNKNVKAANAVIENFNKKYFYPAAVKELADAYIGQGNVKKGIALYQELYRKTPEDINLLNSLANRFYTMQDYKTALHYSDLMLQLAPSLSGIHNLRGYIYKNMNEKGEAKKSFEQAIYYSPVSYDARTQIRLLDNKKELYELFPKTDLAALAGAAPKPDDYPQDNAVMILNEKQMIIYPENAKEERTELAVKILTKAGIEEWKEYRIAHYNAQKLLLDRAEVIKANGTAVKAETNNNGYVVFTNLEVNDVLHLVYRIQDYSSGKIAQYFYSDFDFEYSTPSLFNRFSILVPAGKKFDWKVTNGDITPAITDVEDFKLYSWETKKTDAVKYETYMSAFPDIIKRLYVSSFPDWNFIGEWYNDLTYGKFNPDYVFTDTYNKLMTGNENLSQMEKARIFYEYILKNITYSSVSFLQSNFIPQKPSRTITTRLGDCKDLSTLFVALCRKAGIEANLVLILTRNYGSKNMPLPTNAFNHCIAEMKIEGKTYYLELTDNDLPFTATASSDLNAQILHIPFGNEKAEIKLENLAFDSSQKNSSLREQNIKIDGKNMIVERKAAYIAGAAADYRYNYKSEGMDESIKQISGNISGDFDQPITIQNLKFENLDNLNDTASVSYSFEAKNHLQSLAKMQIFKLPWSDRNDLNIVSAETRKYPLEYWYYQTEEITDETITLVMPAGKKLVEKPVNEKFECVNASYELRFDAISADKMTITRIFTRKADVVMPENYSDFRNFMNRVSDSDNRQYAIE